MRATCVAACKVVSQTWLWLVPDPTTFCDRVDSTRTLLSRLGAQRLLTFLGSDSTAPDPLPAQPPPPSHSHFISSSQLTIISLVTSPLHLPPSLRRSRSYLHVSHCRRFQCCTTRSGPSFPTTPSHILIISHRTASPSTAPAFASVDLDSAEPRILHTIAFGLSILTHACSWLCLRLHMISP